MRIVRTRIYVRISRDDAELKGLGVGRQEGIVRAALPRFGGPDEQWIETGPILDENNTSATDGKVRPALTEGLDLIRAGEIDAIAVYAQDRLLRMPIELEHIIHMHEYVTRVRLATSAGGEINLDDPEQVHSARVNAAGSARESALIRKRRKDEVEQFAARGKRHAQAPFGWSRVHEFAPNGRLTGAHDIINEHEAAGLRHAARRILAGVSLRAVTAEIEAMGVHPRVRNFKASGPSSGKWTTVQLRQYLLRESNAGIRVHHGESLVGIVGDWPALWDLATHQRLRGVLLDPSRKSNDKGSKPAHLLSGIAHCGACGNTRIMVIGGRGGKRYVCVGTTKARGCYLAHREAEIDAHVTAAVEAILADESYAEPAEDAAAALAPLYARLDELAAEQAEWDAAPGIKPAQLAARTVIIDAARLAVEAEISALLPSLNATLDLPNGFAAGTIVERKAAVRNLFASVTLNVPAERGRGRKFHASDVTLVPR